MRWARQEVEPCKVDDQREGSPGRVSVYEGLGSALQISVLAGEGGLCWKV